MTSLLDEVRTGADWIARALDGSGRRAGFSPAAPRDVERFMSDQSDQGTVAAGGLLALGGSWEADHGDPRGGIDIRLRLPDGSLVWPVRRVMRRFAHGPEDSVVGYAAALGIPTAN